MNENEVYKILNTTNNSTPPIQTEEIYNNVKQIANSAPDIWENFFKTVSQIPNYTKALYTKLVVYYHKMVKWIVCWLIKAIKETIVFSNTHNTHEIWKFVNKNDEKTINTVFEGTIFSTFDLDKIKNDDVYFTYLTLEVEDKTELFKSSSLVRKRIENYEKQKN